MVLGPQGEEAVDLFCTLLDSQAPDAIDAGITRASMLTCYTYYFIQYMRSPLLIHCISSPNLASVSLRPSTTMMSYNLIPVSLPVNTARR